MNLEGTLDLVNRGGVLVLVLLALVAGWRGWWVFGPVHREIVTRLVEERDRLLKERDALLDLALSATTLAGAHAEQLKDTKR